TPAAAVEWATTERQRTVCGTLAALPSLMASHGIASPALIIVGEVVELADKLAWYRRSENSAVTIQED
ncbi:siroheme synthase, partial [Chromobacterium piscinae]